MSYSFPYALGICLATLACLAATVAACGLSFQAVSAWLANRKADKIKREAAEKEAYAAALACLAKLQEKSRTR